MRKRQGEGQTPAYQNAPFSCLHANKTGLFPWALKSHDRSFWQKSPQVFPTATLFSPPCRSERKREPTEQQIKLGTRWRLCRNVGCCSHLPSRSLQHWTFSSLPYQHGNCMKESPKETGNSKGYLLVTTPKITSVKVGKGPGLCCLELCWLVCQKSACFLKDSVIRNTPLSKTPHTPNHPKQRQRNLWQKVFIFWSYHSNAAAEQPHWLRLTKTVSPS